MNIRMIVTDLDSTLLRDDKTVSERTIATLVACRKKDVKVVYATARGSSAKKLLPPNLFDGFVRMGGAAAFAGDDQFYSKLISTADARALLLAADNAGIKMAAELENLHYANFNTAEVWDWLTYYEIADFGALDIRAEKMYALPETQAEIDLLRNHLPKGLNMIVDRNMFTMFMNEDATKAKALAALANHWNIDRTDIVAFGDDTNDVDMLVYAGHGVAMGNAVAEARAVADEVCDTNENDGLARWIEENIL